MKTPVPLARLSNSESLLIDTVLHKHCDSEPLCPYCKCRLEVAHHNHFLHPPTECAYDVPLIASLLFLNMIESLGDADEGIELENQSSRLSFRTPSVKAEVGHIDRTLVHESIVTLDDFSVSVMRLEDYDFAIFTKGQKYAVEFEWEGKESNCTSVPDGFSGLLKVNLDSLGEKFSECIKSSREVSFVKAVVSHIMFDAQRYWQRHLIAEDKLKEFGETSSLQPPQNNQSFTKNTNEFKDGWDVSAFCVVCKGSKGGKPLLQDNVCFKCVEKHFYGKGVFRQEAMLQLLREKYLIDYI